jgi:threonine/homoserine/homoserine lactone efflux protein
VLMTLVGLSAYALFAAKMSGLLTRPSVWATLDRLTGVLLIGLGIRVALERRWAENHTARRMPSAVR